MEILRIYDRAFCELGICTAYTRLEYTREFRGEGHAVVEVPIICSASELFMPDGYVTVPHGEMYIIKSVKKNVEKGVVKVECLGLLSLFRGTAIPSEYAVMTDAVTAMFGLVRKAVGNTPVPLSIGNAVECKNVNFRSGRSVLYDDLVSLCYLGGIGMKLEYDGGVLKFSALPFRDRTAGSDEPVTVSGELGTFEAMECVADLEGYKNVAIVSGTDKESGGRYTVTVRSDELDFGDKFPGGDYFDRQMLVNFTSPVSGYMVEGADGKKILDEAAYAAAMRIAGAAALGRVRPKLTLVGYTEDSEMSLGDVVEVYDSSTGVVADAVAECITTVITENEIVSTTHLRADSENGYDMIFKKNQ